jgi:dTDP-L-rhamnose 4-epimerase
MNSRKILITGGAGFIGSSLALALNARGHKVTVLDNLSPQIHGDNFEESSLYKKIHGKVNFIRGDVTSREDLSNALSYADTVVHLAAETGTGQSMYSIERYAAVNVGGTALLLDLIANEKLPISRLVVASSRAIYGEGKYFCATHGVQYPNSRSDAAMMDLKFEHSCHQCQKILEVLPTDETSFLHPTSVYGVTKLTQEQLIMSVTKALGISAISYRYQNVFGPGQSLTNPYTGILSIFSSLIRQGKTINIFEDGKESRDFVYIDDVVDATVAGIEFKEPLIDTFNVGSGVATNVLNVAQLLKKLLKGDSEIIISGQYRVGDIRHNFADLNKIKNKLSFNPKISFELGLSRFVDWVRDEKILGDRYQESLDELRAKGLFK